MSLDILDTIQQGLTPKAVGVHQFAEDSAFCNKPLYPGQVVLLKLMFLEEMTGPEEDILTHWINGGRNGNEIIISPNIRERRDFLLENGYKHFREVQLIGGRRSSKGFVTGLAMAYMMYNTLMLGDPGGHYGISKERTIDFSCIAGSEAQAKEYQYQDFVSTIETCKAFEPYLVKSLETAFSVATNSDLRKMNAAKARNPKIMRDTASLQGKALAANAGTLRGSTTMAAAQPLDAQILTPDGWVPMKEIGVGSRVIGSDGMPTAVLKIHPQGERDIFRIIFSDGTSTRCTEDHLWTFRQKRATIKTKPLSEFRLDLYKKNGIQGSHAKWALPQAPVVQFNSLSLPLDPYLMGALIGDGNYSGRGVNFYTTESDLLAQVQRTLPPGHITVRDPNEKSIRFRITNPYSSRNDVIRGLRSLGMMGAVGPNKHIPDLYKRAQPHERLALLQGLMDTDGSVSGTSVRFGVSSIQLAQDVMDIVRSLGGYATIGKRDNTKGFGGPENYPIYTVCISGMNATTLFRLPRKLRRTNIYSRYTQCLRRVIAIEHVAYEDAQCITIANEDGLYLTDNFIITHNCIDEMAHMLPGESKASAEQVYKALEPSLDQFALDGMVFLNSSPYTKIGMFYECYEANLRPFDPSLPIVFTNPLETDSDDIAIANGNPRNFCFQYPSWALFEGYMKYTSKYKRRTRGKEFGKMITVSPDWNPDWKDEEGDPLFSVQDKAGIIQARAKEAANPETYKVERRGKFAEITDAYLNPTMVDRMYRGIPDGLEQLASGDIVTRYQPLATNHGQGALPAMHRYKFHVDPSSTTAGFGFAIAHIEYFPDPTTGVDVEHVVFDLIKRWDPAAFQGKVIRWTPIINEIVNYAMIFRPFEITFDQHQSADPIQQIQERLTARNNPCRVFEKFATNELNWKRWEVLKTALYQGLVHAPYDEYPNPSPMGSGTFTSKDELKFLQQIATGGKFPRIEKQDIGPVQTKDMADAIAECTYTLIGNLFMTTLRERLSQSAVVGGAPGGYGLGQGGPTGPTGHPGPPGISGYYSRRDEKIMEHFGTRSDLTRGAIGMSRNRRMGQRTRGRW